MNNSHSDILEFIRYRIKEGNMTAREVAWAAGMSPQSLHDFLHVCQGTQIAKAEHILDVLGFEIVLKKKKEDTK
ncbi:MAG: hypothetical protein E7240_04300 [Lachnospiraceae bacterium]|nr:hypothetical protein [Lachnospiraceae bacterium]